MGMTGNPAPEGWYPDPGGSGKPRWWDGTAWEWEGRLGNAPSCAAPPPAPARSGGIPLWAPYYRAPFGEATKRFWKKYSNFTGRASRSEYFQFILVVSTFIPSLALTVRPLHDANLSGLLVFLGLIPFVGWLALIVSALFPPRPEGQGYDLPNYS